MEKKLYEIQIPERHNDGHVFPLGWHEYFEIYVLGKAGGMSKFPVIKGVWIDDANDKIYKEYMMPYHIACTSEQMDKIAKFAKKHYDQISIFVAELGTAKFY